MGPSRTTDPGEPEAVGDGDRRSFVRPSSKRFYGVVTLDSERLNRDFGRVAQEVVQHFTSLVGAEVEVTVEVRVEASDGFPDHVIHTVTENAQTLKFTSHQFEME